MITDVSVFFNKSKSGADSPKPLEPVPIDIISIECGGDDEMARVVYEGDPQVYDSGKMLTVVYKRNESEPLAIENQILDFDGHAEDKHFTLCDALYDVVPSISFFYPTLTRITLKTVGGILTATTTEDVDEIITFLPIPPHLVHIPTVLITELRKIQGLDMDVDRVKWKGKSFAFKRTGEHLEGTIRELTILDRLRNSPNIIDLTAIVINADNTIRGFLMPYMHAGNFGDVFMAARRDLGMAEEDEKPVFNWSVKLTWACQITQGIVDLHAIEAYNGDVKPHNIVLGPAGQAILIDFLPMGFSNEFASPEVLKKCNDHNTRLESMLSGPSDVYSLGLVLYALSQERAHGARVPLWKDEFTPYWFRDIVQRCLNLDPEARPSALEVLCLLQNSES